LLPGRRFQRVGKENDHKTRYFKDPILISSLITSTHRATYDSLIDASGVLSFSFTLENLKFYTPTYSPKNLTKKVDFGLFFF
jgi:hypothetical protein